MSTKAWEYTVDTISPGGVFVRGAVDAQQATERLNWFGNQGWELVSSYATASGHGGTQMLVFIYKRPKSSAAAPPPPIPPQREDSR